MPHIIIDCSENLFNTLPPEKIIQIVYQTAEDSNLFGSGDIKVRVNPYKHYTVGNSKSDFVHIIAYIMEGRSIEQKSNLSKQIIINLKALIPDVPVLSIDIRDIDKRTYCNKTLV